MTVGLRRRPRPAPVVLPDAAAIAATGIGLSFGAFPVLQDVDVTIRAGTVHVLVGPNGAGKSTLLAVLAGDLRPDRGTVRIEGEPVAAWTPAELALRRGVLLQNVEISFPFTVAQVVRMGRAPYAGTDAEDLDDDAVVDAMVATDIVDLADRTYPSLSGGERARVALARVLAQRPRILLLDEPTAALDIRHQEQVFGVARRCADAGDAVVVVMHDLAAAAAHADHVVLMHSGRVHAQGPPDAVFTGELLSDVYECEIEVLRHPRTGGLLVLPCRTDDRRPRGDLP